MTDNCAEELRAFRLLREVLAAGYLVSIYYEDDTTPAIKDSTDYSLLKDHVTACQCCQVMIRKFGPDGKPIPGDGARFVLIFGNGEDGPISDHTDNQVGKHFCDMIQ